MRKLTATLTTIALVCAPTEAYADPVPTEPMTSQHMRLLSGPGVLTMINGRSFDIPQMSHVLDGPAWEKHDLELKRLQTLETRLTAENRSLRDTAKSWQPGWKIMVTVLVVGFAGGVYAHSKF